MYKKRIVLAAFIALAANFSANADDEYKHFPALKSESSAQALCRIQEYNSRLQDIVTQDEISVEGMLKVHEISYTLENALQKLTADLQQAAIDLEEAHLGSEALEQTRVKNHANLYLDITKALHNGLKCD
ncbi:DUF6746 family protein [Glaciecola siphonariae]|uniref:DUF6746 family protein n=1 Tax=Glaciecola siphonariae TaxID=521012 RepID=A0ABV9LWL6_9ALTE